MPKQQGELPGTEAPSFPEIEAASETYVKVRDKRMKLTTDEIVAKAALIAAVREHRKQLPKDAEGNLVYRYDDLLVILREKEDVRVKRCHEEDDDEE